MWMFIQLPHLKGSGGKEINAMPTEVTLGFLRSTGVDEKHLARKPGCQNPRSKGTQPRHQERGSSSAVFWPALKFFKFANQGTASCTCPAKGLHNEEDYISDFLILCETRCLTLPAGITLLPLKEMAVLRGRDMSWGNGLTFLPKNMLSIYLVGKKTAHTSESSSCFRACPSPLSPLLPPSLLPSKTQMEIIC